MTRANIHDRASVERAYPPDAFEYDAGVNSRAKAEVHHGVRIAAPPDPGGDFTVVRAAQHVGETEEKWVPFLAPYMVQSAGALAETGRYGGMAERGDPDKGRDYALFIDRVIEAARDARFPDSPGPGDERLRGARQ